ncbi:uncharacterized protein LOC135197570 [Macrobrachium nipponense]|uniref:uncharacterized protein LOC135197570 n=1 Tax=Macrobrachium nipponense TaxID=159736 RepID=UPI0030C7DE9B
MKSISVAVLFALCTLATAEWKTCFRTRGERQYLQQLKNLEMPCGEPTEQLVLLTVPEGYDKVVPAVTRASRCSGFLCTEKKRCVAIATTTKDVKVELKSGEDTKCDSIQVEEHTQCGCQCIIGKEQCKEHEEFDEEKCECGCPESAKTKCTTRGDAWRWHASTCSCVSMVDGSSAK